MEGSGQLVESLDSVWFFCNVFSSRAQSSNGNTNKEHSPKPTNPTVQTQKIDSPNIDFSSPKCPKCCEFAVEIEFPSVQLEEITIEEAKKVERSSRRKRKSKRKILGELDMGFHGMTNNYFRDFGVVESLDSVWFFCNVFSSRAQSSNGNTNKEHSPKPTNPTVQTQKIDSPNIDFSSPKCPKCCEFAVEIEFPSVQLEEITIEEAKKVERSSRRKRKSKRKILGELDMGFHGMTNNYFRDFGVLEFNYEKTAGTCGYGMFKSKQHLVNMPPLSDGMAMKEHLKSWAYAVACTVR